MVRDATQGLVWFDSAQFDLVLAESAVFQRDGYAEGDGDGETSIFSAGERTTTTTAFFSFFFFSFL